MINIDKGEKHLFKRRLLESNDNAIPWDEVTNITFELFLFGERSVKTWSKTLETVFDADPYVEFELDSTTYRTGDYYLKATLIVNDNTWADGTARDITWETTKIVISDELSTFNESESTADIKFDVVAEPAEPVVAAPTTAPNISIAQINSDGANFNRTNVATATDYESSVNSGTYTSVGLADPYRIAGISQNTTFTHVLRGTNEGGEGPDSNQLTVLTKPNESPALAEDSKTSTSVTFDLTGISGTGTVTYFANVNGGAYQVVTTGLNTFSGLASGTAHDINAYAENISGDGPVSSITITTNAALSPPTSVSTSTDITKFSETITLATNATSSEYRIDGGAWVNIGAATSYEVELEAGTYTRELRSSDGSSFSSPSSSLGFIIPATTDGVETQTLSFEVIA